MKTILSILKKKINNLVRLSHSISPDYYDSLAAVSMMGGVI